MRTMGNAPKSPPVCSADDVCDIVGGIVGSTVCRHGFTACINPAALHVDDTCGKCPTVETPEEPRVDVLAEDSPVCSDVELEQFACPLDEGAFGALVCKNGFTACMAEEDIEENFTCGCCPGDESPRCQEIEEPRLISLTAVSEASLACSAIEFEVNSCNITDGSVGATVCRNGFSACIQADAHMATDICGPCPVVASPEGIPANVDSLIEPEVADTMCTEEMMEEYSCELPNGSDGVFACKFGFSSCVAIEALTESSVCGCCPGDKLCESKKDIPALTTRQGDPDAEFP